MGNSNDLIRAVAYICMTPAAWCTADVVEKRANAFYTGVTTSHWPHEFYSVDTLNCHPNFQPTSLIWQLACPQQCPSWCHQDAEAEAPEPGRISLLPETEFVVAEGMAPVRSMP